MIEPRQEVDLRLADLKRSGAPSVAVIKAICDEFGLALSEAKLRFSQSPAWAAEQAAATQLHRQIFESAPDEGAD